MLFFLPLYLSLSLSLSFFLSFSTLHSFTPCSFNLATCDSFPRSLNDKLQKKIKVNVNNTFLPLSPVQLTFNLESNMELIRKENSINLIGPNAFVHFLFNFKEYFKCLLSQGYCFASDWLLWVLFLSYK